MAKRVGLKMETDGLIRAPQSQILSKRNYQENIKK